MNPRNGHDLRRVFRCLAASVAGVALCASLTACTDVGEVGKFANSAEVACSSFEEIAVDFRHSAERRALYVQDSAQPPVLANAQKYKALEPAMQDAQDILVRYVELLGRLATESAVPPEAPIAATESSLASIGLSSDQAAAGVGLAGAIVKAATGGYRQHKLGVTIHEANAPLQRYLAGLEHIVSDDYLTQLGLERDSVSSYYNDALRHSAQQEPLTAILIRVQMREDLAKIDRRERAAKAYRQILVDVGEAHQKLYDSGSKLRSKDLASLIQVYVADLAKQSYIMAKAV